MKITGLDWTPFRIPFREPFATSHGVLTHREGLVLRLTTDAGLVGLGEASPYPGQEASVLGEATAILDQLAHTLLGSDVQEAEAILGDVAAAGAGAFLHAGVDIALCDALAKGAGSSIAALLAPDAPATIVRVNATIGSAAPEAARHAAAAARAAGFGCVKLKVGAEADAPSERARVAGVRAALGPRIALRLDANGAWSVEQAIRTIRLLEEYELELVEQPVPPGDLAGMRRVREGVATPIAADEDVTDLDAARRLLEMGAADVLVVKPMVVGGLRPARRIVELARAGGAGVVVTTTLDAGIGTAAALHLAATLPADGPACGLATGSLLATDLLVRRLRIHGGQMALPEGPGLGVELDRQQLRRHRLATSEVAPR